MGIEKIEGFFHIPVQNGGLRGSCSVPGDKSISHRALMFASLAVGESCIEGLLEGEDVLATAQAMRAMGADIIKDSTGRWRVWGVGVGGLKSPDHILEMGNSGTSTRLLMGLVAGHPIRAIFSGDASLNKRPMGRVITPLTARGAKIEARGDGLLPLLVAGIEAPLPIDYRLPVASAQVKSAILLSGLTSLGETSVFEPIPTRDHSERLLKAMGADLAIAEYVGDDTQKGGRRITLKGPVELKPIDLKIPGDISSAAFFMVAASLVAGSDIMLMGVGLNPLRSGIIDALLSMGGRIEVQNERLLSGEPVGDIRIRHASLMAVQNLAVEPSRMIDEFPVLFVAAAMATGVSRFVGLSELRVKETDRLAAMAKALQANGIVVREFEDGLEIEGVGPKGFIAGGGEVITALDHRIAMSAVIMGLVAERSVKIDDLSPIATSFPDFIERLQGLGWSL